MVLTPWLDVLVSTGGSILLGCSIIVIYLLVLMSLLECLGLFDGHTEKTIERLSLRHPVRQQTSDTIRIRSKVGSSLIRGDGRTASWTGRDIDRRLSDVE
jgi:hypothetical protein